MGLPSLAIPAGFDAQGMPIGAQLVGRPFGEAALLRVGAALEDATRFYARRPPV
jgi:aspartyl-tRNA(Asn)/glutamyl-tRNA(Gln) amidotransferase subunit A